MAQVLQANCLYVITMTVSAIVGFGTALLAYRESNTQLLKSVEIDLLKQYDAHLCTSTPRKGWRSDKALKQAWQPKSPNLVRPVYETMKGMGENLFGTGTSSRASKKRKNVASEKPAPKPKKPSTRSTSRPD